MKYYFNSNRPAVKKMLVLMAMVFILGRVVAQDAIKLRIGDPAPAIKYSKWLKGTPVNTLQGDKVYVLEFWATWCGPCIEAMPHLSELAKKYADQATFIGVNVWERTGNRPYSSSLPSVESFVKGSGSRMTYNVIADNNDQFMLNNWLVPAGIKGIPTTFVIKNEKLVWIGHPMSLDSVMDPIIAGTFDVAAFKKKHEDASSPQAKRMAEMNAAFDAITNAVKAKDYPKALALTDSGAVKLPALKAVFNSQRFQIYLEHYDEAKAVDYGSQLIKEDSDYIWNICSAISDRDGFSKGTYLFAAQNLQKFVADKKYSMIYDKLALAYSKAGDMTAAAQAEETAVELAKKEIKDPANAGRVFETTVTDYQEKVKKYKSSIR